MPQIPQADDGRLWITQWSKYARTMPSVDGVLPANDAEIEVEAFSLYFDSAGSLRMSDYRDSTNRCSSETA
jgi:hypothetical protein